MDLAQGEEREERLLTGVGVVVGVVGGVVVEVVVGEDGEGVGDTTTTGVIIMVCWKGESVSEWTLLGISRPMTF